MKRAADDAKAAMLIFPTDPRITRCALTAIVQVIVDKNILVVDTAKSAAHTSLIDLIAIRCVLTAVISPNDL